MDNFTIDLGEPDEVPQVVPKVDIDTESIRNAYRYLAADYITTPTDQLGARGKGILSYWKRLDEKLARLINLPVSRIWGQHRIQIPFECFEGPHVLVLTEPVILEAPYGPEADIFDLGTYVIAIPLGGTKYQIHWIPTRDPETPHRHPHHHVRGENPNTCFGSFNAYVDNAMSSGDFATVIRLMVEFVNIHNAASPLIPLRRGSTITHAKLLRTESRNYRRRYEHK